jgi:hypothetical protein
MTAAAANHGASETRPCLQSWRGRTRSRTARSTGTTAAEGFATSAHAKGERGAQVRATTLPRAEGQILSHGDQREERGEQILRLGRPGDSLALHGMHGEEDRACERRLAVVAAEELAEEPEDHPGVQRVEQDVRQVERPRRETDDGRE